MRVGVCIADTVHASGGAGSFNDTINDEIMELKKIYDVVICYQGDLREKPFLYDRDGVQYINVRAYRKHHTMRYFGRRWKIRKENIRRWLAFHPPKRPIISWYDDIAEELGIDIFWFTSPTYAALSTPYIYTIWDIGHRSLSVMPEVSHPIDEWLSREETYREMLPRATYILTGNETGKKEIVANYGVSPEKVCILPFEVSSFCRGESRKPDQELPEHFFLYPAQFWAHKNHIRILQALKLLKEKDHLTPSVVFCGSDKGNAEYIRGVTKVYGIEAQVFFWDFVPDEELKWLYEHADALIYASLLGPNNLPPIEAVHLGCPVILSDLPGHREQMGDAALYFDGLSGDALYDALKRFLKDPLLKKVIMENSLHVRGELESSKYIDGIIHILHRFNQQMLCWKDGEKSYEF